MQELFNFELKFYRAAPVAFFKRLILLNVPVDEQVLDLGYSGSFSLSSLPASFETGLTIFDLSVHAGLQMMLLEPFELHDHHIAGRNQHVPFGVEDRTRHEHLDKARIGDTLLLRIVRS